MCPEAVKRGEDSISINGPIYISSRVGVDRPDGQEGTREITCIRVSDLTVRSTLLSWINADGGASFIQFISDSKGRVWSGDEMITQTGYIGVTKEILKFGWPFLIPWARRDLFDII